MRIRIMNFLKWFSPWHNFCTTCGEYVRYKKERDAGFVVTKCKKCDSIMDVKHI